MSCYYPNGTLTPSTRGTPCNVGAADSACCNPSDACLSNGYCFSQNADWGSRLYRGFCTDQQWQSGSCPQFCDDVATNRSTTVYLVSDVQTGQFCCGSNYTSGQCGVSTHGSRTPFTIGASQIIYNRENGATLDTGVQTNTSSGAISTTTAKAGAAALPVGLGVGIPLFVLSTLSIVVAIYFWRKSERLERESASVKRPGGPAYSTTTSPVPEDVKPPPFSLQPAPAANINAREMQRYELQSPASELPSAPVEPPKGWRSESKFF